MTLVNSQATVCLGPCQVCHTVKKPLIELEASGPPQENLSKKSFQKNLRSTSSQRIEHVENKNCVGNLVLPVQQKKKWSKQWSIKIRWFYLWQNQWPSLLPVAAADNLSSAFWAFFFLSPQQIIGLGVVEVENTLPPTTTRSGKSLAQGSVFCNGSTSTDTTWIWSARSLRPPRPTTRTTSMQENSPFRLDALLPSPHDLQASIFTIWRPSRMQGRGHDNYTFVQ